MFKYFRLFLVLNIVVWALAGCGQGVLLADGNRAPQNNWHGQWRIINVWAEWCKPCWQEIPELNHFHALQDGEFNRRKNNVRLLGWNFDELQGQELDQLVEKMQIAFPVLEEWPENWPKAEIKGLPATIILAPDDSIKKVLWGPQTNSSLHDAVNTIVR